MFRKLERADLENIVRLEIAKLADRMRTQGRTLRVDPEVIAFLLDNGWQPEYGARPLRRAIERWIEDPLSENILRGIFNGVSGVHAVVDNKKILFLPDEGTPEKKHG